MLLQLLYRGLAFVLLASVFYSSANAALSSDEQAAALAQIPACGLECIIQNLPAIGCGLTDTECQCNSSNSTAILQPCLEKKCTYDETFAILRIQATLCDRPHDSYTNIVRVTAYVTGIIPIIVIAMRFLSRYVGGNKLWWDDWIHLVSAILVIPMTACLLMNIQAGLGRHVWDLDYSRVVAIGRWTYIFTLFWGFELLLLKYSILCLYLRIFPNVWLKRAVYFFMAFTAAFTLPLIGLAAFQCIPIHAIWDLKERPNAKCVDWIAVLRLTVVYEVIAEIVLFGLPVPIVLKLQMKTAKKIQLMIFFGLGVIVIIVSVVRIPFLPGVVNTVDPTYTVAPTSITGFVSSGVAHIAASVPALKSLFRWIHNGFKNGSKTTSSNYSKDNSAGTNSKRSYKSLQDSKNKSNFSGQTIGGSEHLTKGSSHERMDPYGLTTLGDVEENGEFVELHTVPPPAHLDTRSKAEQAGLKAMPSPTVREYTELELHDSSSDKSILHKDAFP